MPRCSPRAPIPLPTDIVSVFSPEADSSSPAPFHIDVEDLRAALLAHPVYAAVDTLEHVRIFMEHHVFAVWDFMSLLKRLQQCVTCVSVPWFPAPRPELARFVNEIVLGEECDEDGRGGHASHFELYCAAMRDIGADLKPIEGFLARLKAGADPLAASRALAPPAIASFVSQNLDLALHGSPPAVAAAFFFGREDIIPEMFQRIIPHLAGQGAAVERLVYYMNRHIELDGESHGPLARQLLAALCQNDRGLWLEAEQAARQALESRLAVWDAIHARLV